MDASALPFGGDAVACALAYLEAGATVIPIRPLDKRPLIDWAEYQTRRPTADEVEAWGERWPDMNVAIVTGGASGVTVIDLDGDAGRESVAGLGAVPPTLRQRSPHGEHLFFAYEPGVRNAAGILPGVDVRGDGGYVLVYPSRLPDASYEWEHRLPLAPMPASLVDLTARPACETAPAEPAAGLDGAPGWVTAALSHGAPQGKRNDTAARLAGYFVSRGMPADIVVTVLKPFALACQPAFGRAELEAVVSSVMRYRAKALEAGIVDPPVCTRTRTGEVYAWPTFGVAIEFRGLRSDGDAMPAELTVSASLPGVPAHIHGPVKFNLLASPTRAQLARQLGERLPLAWGELLETACRLAIQSHREGEPAILLSDAPDAPRSMYAVDPLILSDGPTVWFGDGGTGKSLLALAAACAMSGAAEAFPWSASRPFTVAYLDWEWDAWVHRARMRQLVGAAGPNCRLYYRKMSSPMHDQTQQIIEMIERYGIDFLILDSVGMACGDDPEMARSALRFSEAIRSINVGTLWLAHVTKSGDTERPFGSVFWANTARLTWYLAKAQEVGSVFSTIGFYNRKSNSAAKLPTIGLSIIWEGERIKVERADASSEPDLARKMTQREQVVAALKGGAKSPPELAELLDLPLPTLRPRLSEWKASGLIAEDDGRLYLVADVAMPMPALMPRSYAAVSAPDDDW